MFFHILGRIIPTDELIFFREVERPTSHKYVGKPWLPDFGVIISPNIWVNFITTSLFSLTGNHIVSKGNHPNMVISPHEQDFSQCNIGG